MKNPKERWNKVYEQGAHWEKGPSKNIKKLFNYARKQKTVFGIPKIKDFCDLKKGNKVLDLGCGSGRDSIYLAEKGFDVIGLDVSPEALKKANQKIKNLDYKNLQFIEGRAEKLPFDDESFDTVYSTWTLQSCSLKQPASEIYRVLKKDGIAYLAFILTTEFIDKNKFRIHKSEEDILRTYSKFNLLKKEKTKSKDVKPEPHSHEKLVLVLRK